MFKHIIPWGPGALGASCPLGLIIRARELFPYRAEKASGRMGECHSPDL